VTRFRYWRQAANHLTLGDRGGHGARSENIAEANHAEKRNGAGM
jgi:hypothetical protein